MTASSIIYTVFLIFFGYFIALTLFGIFLAIVGFIEEGKRTRESEDEDYPLFYLSSFVIPISIIIPARNEEGWITDSLASVLNLNYPQFEVIIVDDGSTDGTFKALDNELALKPVDMPYIKHFKDGRVREIFKSSKYPFVTVINKTSGVKKAGAVNAGLNIAKNEYICVVDADTVLEPNALLNIMAPIGRSPEKIIGIGSYFGLSNGLEIDKGRVVKKSFSYNPIVAYQNLEYIRSFIGNRIGWSRFNSMPVVAGGFGIWRRDVLYELGGFSSDFTCEDIELTFRAHDYIANNKEKDYKIVMLPYYSGWTEGPSNIRSLILQRNRWQRVTDETVWKYKYMLFNPKFGGFGFLTFPYFVFYEVLGVFFEIASIAFILWGWFKGILDIKIFLAFLCFMILTQAIISIFSILAFARGKRIFYLGYMIYLVALSAVEFLFYRWIISIAKLSGTISYFRGIKTPDQYVRAERVKTVK